MVDAQVQAQYEAYPYPVRNPREEKKHLHVVSPSQLFQLNHFVFGGRRDLTMPLRVLVAGGGTGDAAIMLGQQMTDAGVQGTIVHLDISAASQKIARERARARALSNIEFVQGSLLDVGELSLGTFDYIDCCGVLHHLEDPLAGLRALISVLAPDGGLGIMVYGELGRIGVYHMQEMLRTLAPVEDDASARILTAKRLIKALPPTNWFVRNGQLTDHEDGSDTGIFDLLLHSQDRAYRVPELAALTTAAGLRITGLLPPADYDPVRLLKSPALLKGLDKLDWLQRATFAELLAGNLKKHVFYAVRADNPVLPPSPDNSAAVPVLLDASPEEVAKHVPAGGTITRSRNGLQFSYVVPRLARAIVERCDGQKNLLDIYEDIKRLRSDLDWTTFMQQFDDFFNTMLSINRMVLRLPPDEQDKSRKPA